MDKSVDNGTNATTCDFCGKLIPKPRPGQKYCPGGHCRNRDWMAKNRIIMYHKDGSYMGEIRIKNGKP